MKNENWLKERERERRKIMSRFFLSSQRKTKRRFQKQSFKKKPFFEKLPVKEIGKQIILDEKRRKRDFHFFWKRVVDSEKTQKQKKREKQKQRRNDTIKKQKQKTTPKRKSSKIEKEIRTLYFLNKKIAEGKKSWKTKRQENIEPKREISDQKEQKQKTKTWEK